MKKSAKTSIAKNIDEYLEALPEADRAALQELRQVIKGAAPAAQECISFHIPCFKYKGPLVLFAAYVDHCSLFVVNKNIVKAFEKELQPYKSAGATIHFTAAKPLPAELVQKIGKTRVKENDGVLGGGEE